MPTATDLRKGTVITEEGELFVVLDCHHRTPGNKRGFMQVTFRNLRTGLSLDRKIPSDDKVEIAHLEPREMEYLYAEGDHHCFMDTKTYDQVLLDAESVKDQIPYLRHNDRVRVMTFDGKPVSIELPASVVLQVVETEPGVRGNSATNVFKPAKLETGLVVKVPLFLNPGEHVKVDTRSGEFLERANKPS